MIICKKCGHRNGDQDTFCASCQAFLEWAGEKVAEEPKGPVVPPPPPPPPPGFVTRVKHAVGMEGEQGQAAGAPAPGAPAAPVTPPAAAPSPPPPAYPPPGAYAPPVALPPAPPAAPYQPAQLPDMTGRPAPGISPAAGVPPAAPPRLAPAPVQPAAVAPGLAEPPPRQPAAVAPGAEKPRVVPKVDVYTGQRFNPGDLICGQCGSGNDPSRHFCHRCGSSLAEAVSVKVPWYRRLFPARKPREIAAGDRPTSVVRGESRFRIPLLPILGVILAGLVAAYLLVPSLHRQVDQTAQSWYHTAKVTVAPTNAPVVPVTAAASSETPGHPGRNVIDGYSNTYWEVDLTKDPHPILTLTFSTPTDLDFVYFINGLEDKYADQPRPKLLHITYSNGTSQDITLLDQHKPYGVELHARGVRSMTIQVMSVYDAPSSKKMVLAEIELFRRE